MKSKTSTTKRIRLAISATLCASSLIICSCTTQNTAYQVQTQPMSVDLEKKVLNETKFSGAAIGAAAGAAAGGLLLAVATKAAGGSDEQVKKALISGAVLGGAAGGVKGYKEGEKKGQQIVSKGMTRDQARELVKGARAHNQQLASFNSGLKKKIASVRQFSDPKEKKVAYKTLASQTDKTVKEADKLIATRKKALESERWAKNSYSERSQYRTLTNEMVNERNSLADQLAQVSKLEQSLVY